jgi:hypothetical protein
MSDAHNEIVSSEEFKGSIDDQNDAKANPYQCQD